MNVIGFSSCRLARESRRNGMGMESRREYFESIGSLAGYHMRMGNGNGNGNWIGRCHSFSSKEFRRGCVTHGKIRMGPGYMAYTL